MTAFSQIITGMRDGAVHQQCTDKLQDLISAVTLTGKGGVLTLQLKVRPNGERGVAISAAIKTTEPQPGIGEAMFFTDGSNLFTRDPRQIDVEDEIRRQREKRDAAKATTGASE